MVAVRRGPRASERASTLLETILVTALLALLATALAAFFVGRKPYALRAAARSLGALVDEARAIALTSGSGATIAVETQPAGGFIARLYPYRPLPQLPITATAEPVRTLTGSVALGLIGIAAAPPFALFVSSSGTVSAATWTPASGTLAQEPPCSGALTLRLDDGWFSESHAIPCDDAQLQ